jgi:uncharacterized protein (DUF58 family)
VNGDATTLITTVWMFGIPTAAFAALWMPARALHAYPSRRAVGAVLLLAAASFVLAFASWLWPVVVSVDAVIVLLIAADLATVPRHAVLSVERQTVRVCSLRKPHRVDLMVVNHGKRPLAATVHDNIPALLEPQPVEHDIVLPRLSRTALEGHICPSRRGAFDLSGVSIRVESIGRFWRRTLTYDIAQDIHVYPDLQQLAEYSILARTNRLSLVGVRRTRRVGQDNEFERLRDYTPDDNYKNIDWRATARRNQLTVKDYQRSHNQRLIFMLDCGRMMTNQSEGLSFLDHAFNSMLMLSHVALHHGDSVGLITFSDDIHNYVPPKSGPRQMNRLLHASFNRFPRLVESRYDEAFLYLSGRCHRRSLVVLISNVVDEINGRRIEGHLKNLVGRHLPLAVLLRDHEVFDAVEPPEPEGLDLYRAAAAADLLIWRNRVLRDLRFKGVLAIDTFAEDVTAPLVNRYLEIKARHLL